MEAVSTVLRKQGLAGLTTQRVADEVGLSHPAIHYHFDTKEDMLVAWINAFRESFLLDLQNLDGETPAEKFVSLLECLLSGVDTNAEDESVAMVELHTRAAKEEAFQNALQQFENEAVEIIADLLRDGIEAGQFADVDPEATATFVLSAVDGGAIRTATIEQDTAGALAESFETFVMEVLFIDEPGATHEVMP